MISTYVAFNELFDCDSIFVNFKLLSMELLNFTHIHQNLFILNDQNNFQKLVFGLKELKK